MTKRLDFLNELLLASQERRARAMESAPVSPLVSLHTTEADAAPFIEIVSRLVTATALQVPLITVYAVHIDNWFGPRWVGFHGKLTGAAGVRARSLKHPPLILPPFHPNRVLRARGHHFTEDGLFADVEDLRSLHRHQRSERNLNNTIRGNIVHLWYSGNTQLTRKGVAMIYYRTGKTNRAFYTSFDGDTDWKLKGHIGITRKEVGALISAANV